MPRANPELISPTAHYTGTVWLQHGLSHPAFATLQGAPKDEIEQIDFFLQIE